MRQPGFEPGFEAWQASVITTTLPAQKSSMRSCKRIYIKVISATAEDFAVVWRRRARRCRGSLLAEATDTFEFKLQLIYNSLTVENRGGRIFVGDVDGCVVTTYLHAC